MNQIVMPPKTAASANRSMVESRNAPYGPELPLIRASWPSSMSVKTKNVAVNAPGNSSPIGNSESAAADTPTVPATVIMFGVTGVRASACTIGLNRRAKTGRRKFSMDVTILLGSVSARCAACPALASLPSAIVAYLPGHLLATQWIPAGGLVVTRPSGSRCEDGSSSSAGARGGDGSDWNIRPEARERQARAGIRAPGGDGGGKRRMYVTSCSSAIQAAGRPRWWRRCSRIPGRSAAGRVEDGTTVTDFDEVEIRQKRSVNLTLAPFVARGHGQPARHAGLRRLHRRPAGRAAGGGLRAVRRLGHRRRGRGHQAAVGRVRRGGHAARGRHHQDRPPARRLRGGAGGVPRGVRRRRPAAVPAGGRRRGPA